MEALVKLNNQTAGRDKIARLLQYLSRFLWHRLQQNGSKDMVTNLKTLEYQLSTFRKLLRFGRCFDVLYTIKPIINHKDQTVKYSIIWGKLMMAAFLFADHILWLGRADLCNINTSKWGRISNRYWMYSIMANLLRDLYEVYNLLIREQINILPENGKIQSVADIFSVCYKSLSIVHSNPKVAVDTIKNICDIFIPMTALGYVKFSPGTVGKLGAISSLAALIVLLQPDKKLSPM